MIVIANWKMHHMRASAQSYLQELMARRQQDTILQQAEIYIASPSLWLETLAQTRAEITAKGEHLPLALAAQDCHWETQGAFTGDLGAPMLKEAGASAVIVGHSERRSAYQETDTMIARKAITAQAHALQPICCVGETSQQRPQAQAVVAAQVQTLVSAMQQAQHQRPVNTAPGNTAPVIIAYEPRWAIGTGHMPTESEIAQMLAVIHTTVKARVAARIIYGGSVSPENAAALAQVPGLAGLLVGGASLNAARFADLIRAFGSAWLGHRDNTSR